MLANAGCRWAIRLAATAITLLIQPSLVSELLGQDAFAQSEPADSLSADASDLQSQIDYLANELHEVKTAQAQAQRKDNSKFTFKVGGQLTMDMLWFSQTAESRATVGDANDVFDFRRARLYATGNLWDSWTYATGFDFAQGTSSNGRPVFLDNFIGVNDIDYLGSLRIGHFFEPFMLERSGSNRNTMFMERSLVDMFAPGRNIGIELHDQNESQTLWWAVGTFRSSDNFSNSAGDQEGQTIDTRLVWRPLYDPHDPSHYLHLGGAYSFRDAADGTLQYRTRPEALGNADQNTATTPYFVDTGSLNADYSQLFGGEALWTHGPLTIQSEMVAAPAHLHSGEDVTFTGYYANIGYFLTGEYTPYDASMAITDRVIPIRPVFRRTPGGAMISGPGAWQIASRISHVDLNDGSVAGGRLTDATFSLNWFLTPYHRMKFNYILANLNREAIRSQTSIFGLRFDMDF